MWVECRISECYTEVVHIATDVVYRAITRYNAKLPIFLSTCHYDKNG